MDSKTGKANRLDAVDVRILAQLQRDGRITNIRLADAVGLSASPCWQRVKRLESAGYISGYGAHINLSLLAESMTVFTEVTLADHKYADFSKFELGIRPVEELTECHLVSGGFDYLLRFRVRNVLHYQTVIEKVLGMDIGVEKYFSYIVMKSPIERKSEPIARLLDAVMPAVSSNRRAGAP